MLLLIGKQIQDSTSKGLQCPCKDPFFRLSNATIDL